MEVKEREVMDKEHGCNCHWHIFVSFGFEIISCSWSADNPHDTGTQFNGDQLLVFFFFCFVFGFWVFLFPWHCIFVKALFSFGLSSQTQFASMTSISSSVNLFSLPSGLFTSFLVMSKPSQSGLSGLLCKHFIPLYSFLIRCSQNKISEVKKKKKKVHTTLSEKNAP